MEIKPIGLELQPVALREDLTIAENVDFGNFLIQQIDQINTSLLSADKVAENYVLEKEGDIQDVMLAMEEANMSLQLAIEVRNKMLEGFQELMRMQL